MTSKQVNRSANHTAELCGAKRGGAPVRGAGENLWTRCQAKFSDLWNLWLHAICACAEWYSRSCISQAVAVHWDVKTF